jgi:hypothetical protein
MNYKTLHPNLNDWPHYRSLQELKPWPLKFRFCEVHEILSPCEKTTFLRTSFLRPDDENYVNAYLAEASRNCPKRLSYEIGQISRRDFWSNQDWIIRIVYSLYDESYSRAEYIKPMQFCDQFKERLKCKNDLCLFDQQLEALENSIDRQVEKPEVYANLMRAYQEFYPIYVSRMGRRAA